MLVDAVTRIRLGWAGLPRRAVRAALDLLLPLQCVLCEASVEQPGQLCGACFREIGFITPPFCTRCGVPFAAAAQGGAEHLCPTCRDAPPLFAEARAAFRYDRPVQRLILPLKHADRTDLAQVLAPHMARAGAVLLQRADVLVPVPLHRRRLFHRRYNQAALLAQAVGRLSRRPALVDGLLRLRPTVPLGEMSPAERATTVAEAFAVRPSRAALLAGQHVLLVDDVMTSGATANACTVALLAAGATGVDVLVAARVPDPRLR